MMSTEAALVDFNSQRCCLTASEGYCWPAIFLFFPIDLRVHRRRILRPHLLSARAPPSLSIPVACPQAIRARSVRLA